MTDPVANRRVLAAGRPSPPHPVDQTVLLLARWVARSLAISIKSDPINREGKFVLESQTG